MDGSPKCDSPVVFATGLGLGVVAWWDCGVEMLEVGKANVRRTMSMWRMRIEEEEED